MLNLDISISMYIYDLYTQPICVRIAARAVAVPTGLPRKRARHGDTRVLLIVARQ